MRTTYLAALAATAAMPAFAQDRESGTAVSQTVSDPDASIDRAVTSLHQGDVVVTALKREQEIQDVPASVSVLSNELLRNFNATDFSRVVDAVPGVAFATTGPGNSQYIIRGIGGVGFVQSPTTGIYLDEMPLQTRALRGFSQPDPQLFDVARVEVLRGPQGVLFGSSSMGGLVRIVTNQPDATGMAARAEGSVATVRDGGMSWDTKGMLNVPIVTDILALRITGSIVRQGGWIDDVRPATGNLTENVGTGRVKEDVNWTRTGAVRGALRWTPTSTLAITPSLVWQNAFSNADRPHSDVTFGKRARVKARYQDTFARDRFVAGSLRVENSFDALGGLGLISNSSYLDRNSRLSSSSSLPPPPSPSPSSDPSSLPPSSWWSSSSWWSPSFSFLPASPSSAAAAGRASAPLSTGAKSARDPSRVTPPLRG